MKKINPSIVLATICWLSLFILTWLILLDFVPVDWIRGVSWVFFLVTGIIASAASADRQKLK